MAVIVEANVMNLTNRGKVCLATLDEWPQVLRSSCLIDGVLFNVSPVHVRWKDPNDARPVIGLALEGRDLPADWFVGKQVTPG